MRHTIRRAAALACLALAPALHAQDATALAPGATGTRAASPAASAFALAPYAEHTADLDMPALFERLEEDLVDLARSGSAGPDEFARAEAAIAWVELFGSDRGSPRWTRLADAVVGELPADAHGVRARLARLARRPESLHPVDAWSVIGPFDNERGRGMSRRGPVEKDAAAEEVEGEIIPVRWRVAPPMGRDGVVAPARMVYPASQVCVMARTWVHSAEPRDAWLLLGASEEVRVWWRGEPVFEARGLHAYAPDAHAVEVRLEAGWNELVLKVGNQEGALLFDARFVEPGSMAPLALEASATAPEGVQPAELGRAGRRIDEPRTVATFGAERRLVEAPEDARDHLALAVLAAVRRAAPAKERPGFTHARRALELRPQDLGAALVHLSTMRVGGALDVEEDLTPWVTALRAAVATHGDRATLMLDYAEHAEDHQGLPERALSFVERGLARTPEAPVLRLALAALLEDLGYGPQAEAAMFDLARSIDASRWFELVPSLVSEFPAGSDEAMALLDAAESMDPEGVRWELRSRRSAEARQPTLAWVQGRVREALRHDPGDIDTRLWAARQHLAAGQPVPAVAFLEDARRLHPDAPMVNAWLARARLAAGDVAGAIAAQEHVLRLDRSNVQEERFLEFLRTRTGGDVLAAEDEGGRLEETFAEPLADIVARHPSRATGASADAPREVLLNRFAVEVGPDGTARRYRRLVERVLTAAGTRELDQRTFRAYPGQEEIRVLAARVLRADGSVLDARTGRTGWRGGFLLDLPPLEVGDVVDVEWRHDDLAPSIFGDYFGLDAAFTVDPRLPVAEAEVVVIERPGVDLRFHLTAADGLEVGRTSTTLEDGAELTRFTAGGIEPREAEPYQPPAKELSARVQASTYANWTEFGQWWWSLIREEIAASDEMRAKVAELTAGKETPLDKLRAIYGFVVTDIRYQAWEFGIHGYQPYSAPVIFSRGFGDCKDKAILMKSMLAEAGIEAWPVVINSEPRRTDEDLSVAMVQHFNHCIAYVPAQEGIPEMFLDGTARLHPLEVLPDSDRGARVVVVRDDGVTLAEVPFPTADENRVVDEMLVDLGAGPDAGAKVEMVRRPMGRFDPRMRMTFSGDDASRTEATERLATSILGPLRGEPQAEHPDYEDLTRPLEIVIAADPESVGRRRDDTQELPSTFAAQDLLQSVASATTRETDVLLDVPWSSEQVITYVLPATAELERVPQDVTVRAADLEYVRSVEVEEPDEEGLRRVVIRELLALPSQRVPAERYGEFRRAARAVDDAQRETLDLRWN